jgi:hypothetical protein
MRGPVASTRLRSLREALRSLDESAKKPVAGRSNLIE